jgi:hypothetical protein
MRRLLAIVLCCLAAPLLHAQFQEPTKQELQMTADPQAPGAAAVYLYREEQDLGSKRAIVYYDRIKVLTEKGKEAATISIPYVHWKVEKIEGRTIHADGTVIPLTAKPEDLMDFKSKGYQENSVTFTLPSVEVGSILEYRLEIHDIWVSQPTWELQQRYFVHKAHYYFDPINSVDSPGMAWATHSDGVAKVVRDKSGRFTFDIENVPPIPTEDWMPPLNSIRWRVEFYVSDATSATGYWKERGKIWSQLVDQWSAPGRSLKEAVQQIVAPNDTDEQKARKIYAAVQQLENTSFTREKSKAERKKEKIKDIKNVEDVWKEKRGESSDLALLCIALARAAGLQAYALEVVDRDRAVFDPTYLSFNQLDALLPIVVIGGKEQVLDPGQKMCPFGLVRWNHSMAGGIRQTAQGPAFALTPGNSYVQNTAQRVADLTIAADGTVKGSIRYVLHGQEALLWRQRTLRNDEAEVKKQFDESIHDEAPQGVTVNLDHFLALDDPDANLIAVVNVSGSLGTATGKHFFLPALFFESRAAHPFVAQDKRLTPVDVQFPRQVIDSVTYRLPAGYTVESAPPVTNIPWPKSAALHIDSKVDGNTVQVDRQLSYNFTLLDAKNYGPLHDFFQKVAAADQQQLVLIRQKPPAAGQ